MYKQVSDEFKKIVKSNSIISIAKLVFTEPQITIEAEATAQLNSSLVDITIKDFCYNNGQIIGTAMTKEAEINIINKDNLDLANKEFELFVGVELANGEYEYIPYGKYIVTDFEDTKSNNRFKIIAYDYMTKLNTKIKENKEFKPTLPITLKNFKKELLRSYGLECEEQILPNDNFIITVVPNFEEMTGRVVLGKVAELQGSFAKINRNNKVQFYLKNQTNEKISATDMNNKLDINSKQKPINVVTLGLKGVNGENVTLTDEESIVKYGENAIVIEDNPFVYTQALREDAIEELFNYLKGFTYVATKFNYKARLYLDCGDLIEVENVQDHNYVTTMVLNQTIKIPATRKSTLDNQALSETQVKNKYISRTEQINQHTELSVNKQTQEIKGIVEQIGERGSRKTTITEDIEGLRTAVNSIEGLTKTEQGIQKIFFKNCTKNGRVVELHIFGNNVAFSGLFPSEHLEPSDRLTPNQVYDYVKINHYNSQGIIDRTQHKLLGIREVLRQSQGVFDEYVLIDKTAKIIRRVNPDGTIKETPVEELIPYEIELPLDEGDNELILEDYIAMMTAVYVPKNQYTDTFQTIADMQTEINQTSTNVQLLAQSMLATNLLKHTAFTEDRFLDSYKIVEYEATAKTNVSLDTINKHNACNSLKVQFLESGTVLEAYNPIQFSTYKAMELNRNLYFSFYIKSPITTELELGIGIENFKTELYDDLIQFKRIKVEKDQWLEVQIDLKKVTEVLENSKEGKIDILIKKQDTTEFNIANPMLEYNNYPSDWSKAPQDTNTMVDKNSVVASLNVGIKDGQGAIEIKGNYLDLDTDQLKILRDKVTNSSTMQILGSPTTKYRYTWLDCNLALLHLKGDIKLPFEICELYRCSPYVDNPVGTFTVGDTVYMERIAAGLEEPVKSIADIPGLKDKPVVKIDPGNSNAIIELNIADYMKTQISMYQIGTYMLRTSKVLINNDYLEGQYARYDNKMLGINLDGIDNKITINDPDNKVGTEITSTRTESYNMISGFGNYKGNCMHSPEGEVVVVYNEYGAEIDRYAKWGTGIDKSTGRATEHTYFCHVTPNGADLVFKVDPSVDGNADFNASSFWIHTGTSDERLKTNVEPIPKNLLKAINEIEIKQFNFIDDEDNKEEVGIIAQELISICEKYKIDIMKYSIVKKGKIKNDGIEYYSVDYVELLKLKAKCLEDRVDNLENKIDELYNLIKGGKK